MGEKVAREKVEGQITPKEWLEWQFLRGVTAYNEVRAAWNKLSLKAKVTTVGGVIVVLGSIGAWRFKEGQIEPPTVSPAEGKTTSEVTQAQAEAPKIAISSEAAPGYFERASPTQDFLVQIQAPEPIIPPEEPPPKVEAIIYEVQPDDTLISIAEKYGFPWQVLYGKNIIEVGYNPNDIKAGDRLDIPDATRDKKLIEKLDPRRITKEQFPSIDLLARQDPEKLKELRWRAVAVVAYDLNERQIFFKDWREFRDFRIFDYHGEGEELNYVNVLETLARYEFEFERNPAIERVLQEMTPGIRVMNEILMDKASPEWFKDGEIPQLPEDLRGRFVFEGGKFQGLGHPCYPSINLIGEHDSYKMVKQILTDSGFHELIHSIPQFESIIKPHPWVEQSEEDRQGLLRPENRSVHLGHKAMDVLTLPAMEAVGFPPTKIDSRILYIYWVLKREGVPDPYKEILSAAVTMNGDRLWQVYEEVRRPDDFSMDELFTYRDLTPDGLFDSFNQKKALEELRAEYTPYLSE
ncbi:MAG: hypothetical protein LiPW31_109 [Microgenomates group bacterium LiPW_31]|nr:MAG: hypothetical protein LiPW31_109 [Microgenomates group bacterium LiPW_31]